MTYIKNGKKINREEFMKYAKGFDFGSKVAFTGGSFIPFVSPIDGREIASNKQLSAHNREYNVQQVGHELEKVVNNNKLEQ